MSSRNNPDNKLNLLLDQAINFHMQGKLDLAEANYKKLINYLPNNTILLSNLGAIALQKGDLQYGLELTERSLKIDKNQPNALNNYGVMLQKLSRTNEALKIYNLAIEAQPDNAEAYANKGNALSELKNFQEAQLSYDLAIYYRPNYAKAHFNKGKSLKECGELKKAISSFDLAVEFNPNIEYISGEILHLKMLLCLWNNFSKSQKELKN
ncbi:tetratricopeptide repeat protein, partial [Candidatus Pseudothioglobus singularis]|nr:tetratricopeptide repeat protein [Candidatus Pseudothioglobus singularis]